MTRPLHLPDSVTCPISKRDEVCRIVCWKDRVTLSHRNFSPCRRFQCQQWAKTAPTADQITCNGATNEVLNGQHFSDNELPQKVQLLLPGSCIRVTE